MTGLQRSNPAYIAAQFHWYLSRIEAAVRSSSSATGGLLAQEGWLPFADNDQEACLEEEIEEVWREKVAAYTNWLRTTLEKCHGLSEAVQEKYILRVNDLQPALERALELRRIALEPPAPPPPVVGPEVGNEDAREAAIGAALAMAISAEPPAEAAEAAEQEVVPPASDIAPALPGGSDFPPARPAAPEMQSPVPWRRPAASKHRDQENEDYNVTRAQIEEEMNKAVEGLKEDATILGNFVKKDNLLIPKVEELQNRGLDQVKEETQKGKKMIRSGQLGFLCTMAMLIVSVIIFFMMIPFIIFT